MAKKRIAIIGSGISGLGCAYQLNKNSDLDVHLFEAKDRLGGHSYSVDVELEGQNIIADMGFLVFNDLTYPNLLELFSELEIQSHPSDMSFSVQLKDQRLEWCGTDMKTLLSTYRNFLRPRFYRMLRDILHFNKRAQFYLESSVFGQWSLSDLINNTSYSKQFYDWYLIPMGAAIWSTPYKKLLEFPAETFIRFCVNHRLLQVNDRPQWHSPINGARDYVNKISSQLQNIHLNSPVTQLKRLGQQWRLSTPHAEADFDSLIFASSGQVAHQLTKGVASDEASEVLQHFKTCDNLAVLHTDAKLMPKNKMNWSAWNYHRLSSDENERPVSLTYWLNQLKDYKIKTPLLVSLNPNQNIDSHKILHTVNFSHPMFDKACLGAQKLLPSIQGKDNLWFCGAWTKYGFHEDGYSSALNVVKDFLPLQMLPQSFKRSLKHLGAADAQRSSV